VSESMKIPAGRRGVKPSGEALSASWLRTFSGHEESPRRAMGVSVGSRQWMYTSSQQAHREASDAEDGDSC
jgi:hypothetical protein